MTVVNLYKVDRCKALYKVCLTLVRFNLHYNLPYRTESSVIVLVTAYVNG